MIINLNKLRDAKISLNNNLEYLNLSNSLSLSIVIFSTIAKSLPYMGMGAGSRCKCQSFLKILQLKSSVRISHLHL